jgi:hypothetical protein
LSSAKSKQLSSTKSRLQDERVLFLSEMGEIFIGDYIRVQKIWVRINGISKKPCQVDPVKTNLPLFEFQNDFDKLSLTSDKFQRVRKELNALVINLSITYLFLPNLILHP